MGPSYSEIAKRYQGDVSAQNRLAKKIIAGGNGSWGDFMMPAHPALSETDANTIVKYILTIGEQIKAKSLPLTGAYKTDAPEGEKDKGFFVFRAAYTDKGTKLASAQTSEDKIILRNSLVPISRVDQYKGVEFNRQIFLDKSDVTATASGSFLGLNQIDLTGIKQVEFTASSISSTSNHSGWNIEIRIDSPTGKLIGQTSTILSESYYLNRKGERVNAVLGPINEVHDVYFVLTNKNPTDKKEKIKVKDIKFIW
jgi:cytochrome c